MQMILKYLYILGAVIFVVFVLGFCYTSSQKSNPQEQKSKKMRYVYTRTGVVCVDEDGNVMQVL